jgi:hypothetical protein
MQPKSGVLMRIHRTTVLVAVLSASVLFSSTCVLGRTWYVKPDQTGDAPTIQAAIDSSGAGDTVLVAPGTYTQTYIFFQYKDMLSIIGEEGAEKTILHLSGMPYYIFAAFCDSLIVKGFTFEESAGGGVIFTAVSRSVIESNIFRNIEGHAIHISGPFPAGAGEAADLEALPGLPCVTIRDNLIYSNGAGISIFDWTDRVRISNNTIACNVEYGIDTMNMTMVDILNNIIIDNAVGVGGYGVHLTTECNDVFGNGDNYQMSDRTGLYGNISMDPQFCGVDPVASGNFYIQSDSPCAPGNHPEGYACGLIGKFPVGCGTISTKERSWGEIKSLFK